MTQEARQCQNCKNQFTIEPDDFAFYEKIKVPAPTWCPPCRLQRRLSWRNERSLHKRICDLCRKDIIAMYPQDVTFPVYCRECWYSDKWDGTQYGREYNFNKPFFTQFKELQNKVPRVALQVDKCVNCEYANQIANCKNCYLIFSGSDNEDSMYSYRILNSKNLVDCFIVLRGEYCYECIECLEVSQLIFVENCASSTGLSFCFDARGSQDCFLSSNIWNKSHVFENKQCTKEDYKQKMKDIDTGSYKNFSTYAAKFEAMRKKALHKHAYTKNVTNVVGNTISYSKDCYHCFNGAELENCRYCLFVNKAKDSMDINNGCCVMELNYEVNTMGVNAYNVKLSSDAWPEVRNITYCDICKNGCHDLFGCIGLRKKEYCILNKEYTKEKYEELVLQIIDHLNEASYKDKKGKIYAHGEFFPTELSPFPYNETPAYDYFPLDKERALAQGFNWRDLEKPSYQITVSAEQLPDHIRDVDDSIVKEVISCAHQGKCGERCVTAFRIVSDELNFYRKMNIPLPRLCPNCRYYARFRRRNPINLWHRQCVCDSSTGSEQATKYKNTTKHSHHLEGRCPNEFETSYAPERKEIVYCEQCYQAEVV